MRVHQSWDLGKQNNILNSEAEARLLGQVPYAKTHYCGLDPDPRTVASIQFEGMGSAHPKKIYTSTDQTLGDGNSVNVGYFTAVPISINFAFLLDHVHSFLMDSDRLLVSYEEQEF